MSANKHSFLLAMTVFWRIVVREIIFRGKNSFTLFATFWAPNGLLVVLRIVDMKCRGFEDITVLFRKYVAAKLDGALVPGNFRHCRVLSVVGFIPLMLLPDGPFGNWVIGVGPTSFKAGPWSWDVVSDLGGKRWSVALWERCVVLMLATTGSSSGGWQV